MPDHVDKPAPSVFYMAFLLVLFSVILSLPLFMTAFGLINIQSAIVMLVGFSVPALIFILLVHSAFSTVYKVAGGYLTIKSGIIISVKIPLDEIKEVKKLKFIRRVLGRGIRTIGACNRFTNGLEILTGNRSYMISPSDPDIFYHSIIE